jgi:hypothetical protein
MDIGANVEHEHSTSNRKRYVRGCGPKTVKSRRGKWVEEDMTMDPADTTNDCIEQEVGQDYNTWDEYFEKIDICGCFVCREKKQSNLI